MKKKIISILLTLCMVVGLIPFTGLAGDNFTVTVNAGAGGKVSADGGTTWSSSVTVTVPDGEKIGDRVTYRADEGYELESAASRANITAVSAGLHFTAIIDDKGQAYTAGDSGNGKRALGNPLTLASSSSSAWFFAKPTNGIDGSNIKAIATGKYHTVVLDGNGDVYTTGSNTKGQLGRDVSDALKEKYPNLTSIPCENCFYKVNVGDGTVKIKAIAASKEGGYCGHTVLIDENGKVWTAGSNYYMQLGRTVTASTKIDAEFKQVDGDVNNTTIVAAGGENHTVLLDHEGNVWTAGDSFYGANGQNGARCRVFTKCNIDGNPKIVAIATGSSFSILLDENGNVYATGQNSSGQLGLGDYTERKVFTKVTLPEGVKIASIAAGSYYTVLIDEDGKVYTAGKNDYGQLGQPLENAKINIFTPVTINGIGEHKIVSAAAGEDHTVLLDDVGRIWTAGNTYGNQGICRLLKPYKESDPNFALAMSSPVLQTAIDDLAEFTVTGNNTIDITFKEKEKINVTYDLNGGDWISGYTPPTFYYKGDSFSAPDGEKLVKNGYLAQSWTISKTADENTLLYTISWEAKSGYTVVFDSNGGSNVDSKTNVKWTDKVLEGITAPTKNGYAFVGFKCGEVTVNADTTYADLAVNDTVESVTITAQWSEKGNYSVEFDTVGGTAIGNKTNVKWTDKVLEGVTDAVYGYEFNGLGDGSLTPTFENDLYSGIIKSAAYAEGENSFKLIVTAKTSDGFTFTAEKIIEIQNEHSGGKATCKDKAVCEVCGESYGEVDANNHTDLKHTEAKAATKTAEGNIEYWYCEDCGKYYKDSAATIEITKADTAIAKLENKNSDNNNSNSNSNTKSDTPPQTGDNSDMSLLWLALLLVSFFTVAAATVADKNKKHREN